MSTTSTINPSGIGPSDQGWDSISTFTGKPLTQKAREANDRRRVKNQAMLAGLPGDVEGRRLFKVNRMVPVGGTRENPKMTMRSHLVKVGAGLPSHDESITRSPIGAVNAKIEVQAAIDAALDGLR